MTVGNLKKWRKIPTILMNKYVAIYIAMMYVFCLSVLICSLHKHTHTHIDIHIQKHIYRLSLYIFLKPIFNTTSISNIFMLYRKKRLSWHESKLCNGLSKSIKRGGDDLLMVIIWLTVYNQFHLL